MEGLSCLKGKVRFLIAFVVRSWRHFRCNIMGWHNGKGNGIGFDGCSFTATCSICGKKVLMDSQGNWF